MSDQLATLLRLGEGAVGDSLAFAAAAWFLQSSQRTRIDPLAFADEHGLDAQRVYSILCWVHGRDPARYPEIVSEGWLPAARAERCPADPHLHGAAVGAAKEAGRLTRAGAAGPPGGAPPAG